MYTNAKLYVDKMLNPADEDSHAIDSFIILLITCNVIAVVLETDQQLGADYAGFFLVFEILSSCVFALEYVLRLWVSNLHEPYTRPILGRIRYLFSFLAIVDLVAILPFLLQWVEMDLRTSRAIRLLRIARILKMGRYATAVGTIVRVVKRKREELAMTMFLGVMVLIFSASSIYFAEHEAQPDAFQSIPQAMWWAVVTLTSVGYGDVSPVTGLGKFIGAIVCGVGVLFVALPAGIIASGYAEEFNDKKAREHRAGKLERRGAERASEPRGHHGPCPHCGKDVAAAVGA